MKRILFITMILAALACGAFAQETTPEPKTPDPSLEAAGESLCAAGVMGDVETVLKFMFHPAMIQKFAELQGYESAEQLLDSFRKVMEQGLKDTPLLSCRVNEAYSIKCPDFAIKQFETFDLKVQKCGMLNTTTKSGYEGAEEIIEDIALGMVDGKWYIAIDGMAEAGNNSGGTAEGDPALQDFAANICKAMEAQDPSALEKLRMAGIKATDPVDNEDLYNWDNYLSHLLNSWKMNVEPVSCSVRNTLKSDQCDGGTLETYGAAGYAAEACGNINLSVFMDKDMWYNGMQAVYVDGAWHIDPNALIELSRVSE